VPSSGLKAICEFSDLAEEASALPVLSYQGRSPRISPEAFVSPSALVIGDVEVSEEASIWPGAVLRGDVAKITVGRCTNLQENVVVHGGDLYDDDGELRGHIPAKIGEYVTVAHGAVLHGCEIRSCVTVGIRAVVYDGSLVEEGSVIGIGAVLLEGSRIPPRSVVVGIPGRVIKTLDEQAPARLKEHAERYRSLAESHSGTLFRAVD